MVRNDQESLQAVLLHTVHYVLHTPEARPSIGFNDDQGSQVLSTSLVNFRRNIVFVRFANAPNGCLDIGTINIDEALLNVVDEDGVVSGNSICECDVGNSTARASGGLNWVVAM